MSLAYSACIEVLFRDVAATAHDRVHAAREAGFGAVEFWTWREKDLEQIERALHDTGTRLTCIVSDPLRSLVDPQQRQAWLEGLDASIAVARRLGASFLIAQAGDSLPGVARAEQRASLVRTLQAGAERLEGTGVRLLLEPLNTRVDHPGYFLDHTPEALDVIETVGRDEVRLLYDIYHSVVMGETPQRVLDGHLAAVAHVHLADAPGRHELGSGGLPWRSVLDWLEAKGYAGYVGLEYWPTTSTIATLAPLDLGSGPTAPR